MTPVPAASDGISLTGIRAYGRHGANLGEKDVPQPFDVDVHLTADLRAARRSDALADTLDYDSLHRRIVRIVRESSFDLIERLAQELLDAVFADERVSSATVTVAKPRLLQGATPTVSISSSRP
jgi:dihydroneopterin aldolase